MLDGPPAGPSTTFPDRVPYERIGDLHSPVAVPFGVASIGLGNARRPGRRLTGHSRQSSRRFWVSASTSAPVRPWGGPSCSGSVAALAVVCERVRLLLYVQRLAGPDRARPLGTLATRVCDLRSTRTQLDPSRCLAAIFAGATVATYQAVGSAVRGPARCHVGRLGCPAARRRLASIGRRRRGILYRLDGDRARSDPTVAPSASTTRRATGSNGLGGCTRTAFPGEVLGLIPRVGTAARPGLAWSAIALALTIAMVLFAVRGARRGSRGDVLLSTGAASLVAIGLLQLPGPSPYVSMKIGRRRLRRLTLVPLSGLVGRTRWPRTRVAVYTAGAICFVFSTGIVAAVGMPHLVSASALAPIRPAVQRLPADAAIGIRIEDEWRQAWAVYYLRDRRLSVHDENVFVTGFGLKPKGFTQKLLTPTSWKRAQAVGRASASSWARASACVRVGRRREGGNVSAGARTLAAPSLRLVVGQSARTLFFVALPLALTAYVVYLSLQPNRMYDFQTLWNAGRESSAASTATSSIRRRPPSPWSRSPSSRMRSLRRCSLRSCSSRCRSRSPSSASAIHAATRSSSCTGPSWPASATARSARFSRSRSRASGGIATDARWQRRVSSRRYSKSSCGRCGSGSWPRAASQRRASSPGWELRPHLPAGRSSGSTRRRTIRGCSSILPDSSRRRATRPWHSGSRVGCARTLIRARSGARLAAARRGVVAARRPNGEAVALVLALCAALAFSPIVWLHYFVLLLVPIALASPRFSLLWLLPIGYIVCARQRRQPRHAAEGVGDHRRGTRLEPVAAESRLAKGRCLSRPSGDGRDCSVA